MFNSSSIVALAGNGWALAKAACKPLDLCSNCLPLLPMPCYAFALFFSVDFQ